MVSSHSYIPLWYLIGERVKYPCETIRTEISHIQITLRHLTLREGIIYNHWLVNKATPLTRIITGMNWNIQGRGVYLDMDILSMKFQPQ